MAHQFYYSVKKAFLGTIGAFILYAAQLASAQSATVTLAWNANPESNIAGYRLYYGTTSHNYAVMIPVGNSTTASVSNLAVGTVYYFATTAYNTAGTESLFSSEVAYAPPAQTPTPSPSPTPASVNISGNVSYCSNPVPGPVDNVTLTVTGGGSGSTLSDSAGNYQLSSLAPGGSYTVTPTKNNLAPGSPGINTVDVVALQRHFLTIAPLPVGCQRSAADVNGDTLVNTTDAIAVQRFSLGRPTGFANVGTYQFTPASRAYPGIASNQTGQNYDTLVIGDVAAGFVELPDDPSQFATINGAVAQVALPEVAVDQSVTDFVAEVTTTAINPNDNLVGFQGDFTFDETVVSFQSDPVQNAGLTEGNWNVSANVLPGEGPIRTLRISAYSNDFTPLSGAGTLFNLHMTRVDSRPGDSTPLIWAATTLDQFSFIDSDLRMQTPRSAAPGNVILELTPPPGDP